MGLRESEPAEPPPKRWFNRNVFGFGLTSFLGDFCHEMATAVLPQFMQAIGASAAALGFVEGVADALSSFVKLGAGYHSDKIGHRKGWSVLGYAMTAVPNAIFAFAFAWPLILLGRSIGWLGRGIRGSSMGIVAVQTCHGEMTSELTIRRSPSGAPGPIPGAVGFGPKAESSNTRDRSGQLLCRVREPAVDGRRRRVCSSTPVFQTTAEENSGCRDNRTGGFQRF